MAQSTTEEEGIIGLSPVGDIPDGYMSLEAVNSLACGDGVAMEREGSRKSA